MRLFVLAEVLPDERRAAISPDAVKRLAGLGISVSVEAGAGARAGMPDDVLAEAGAAITGHAASGIAEADIVVSVRPPDPERLATARAGTILLGMLAPYGEHARIEAYAAQGLAAFAFEFVPRITRAQGMDALTSQANLGGYAAVVEAAQVFGKAFPMMVTAAGTIAPTRVLVLGAGVAGLQAIATARRLGAIVSAMDVRPAVREQVESLGATYLTVGSAEERQAETAGGYAREMSADYRVRQAEKLKEELARTDVVVTTALIPGRTAPILLTDEMLSLMRPGSVVVDMAAEQGGNVEASEAGRTVEKHGVTVIGRTDLPSTVAIDASALYARNIVNFLTPLVDREAGKLAVPWDDEIVSSTLLCRDGRVCHPSLVEKQAPAPA